MKQGLRICAAPLRPLAGQQKTKLTRSPR